MQLKMAVHFVDVQHYLNKGEQPSIVINSEGLLNWHSVTKPFNPADHVVASQVTSVCQGDYVVCPLFPYVVPQDPMSALGFVNQLGFKLGAMFPSAVKMVMALGQPLQSFQNQAGLDSYRLWIGFAISSGGSRP